MARILPAPSNQICARLAFTNESESGTLGITAHELAIFGDVTGHVARYIALAGAALLCINYLEAKFL
jgi:type IV secretory pathway VirB2 component (pilin)